LPVSAPLPGTRRRFLTAARVDAAAIRAALGGPMPEHGEDPTAENANAHEVSRFQLARMSEYVAKYR
jgi:hypothetical protein